MSERVICAKTDLDKILDFGASRNDVPENKCRGRIVVDELGREVRCEDTYSKRSIDALGRLKRQI